MSSDPPDQAPTPTNPYKPPDTRPERPFSVATFLVRLVGVGITALASLIAFVATCVPVGIAALVLSPDRNGAPIWLIIGVLAGLVVAGFVGYWLTRWTFRRWEPVPEGQRDREDRP